MWVFVKYGKICLMVVIIELFVTTPVFGKSFKKNLKKGANMASSFLSSPQVQNLIHGHTGLGSLSWPQITNLLRTVTSQVDELGEDLEEAEEWVDHFRDVGVGVITTFSILMFLAIIWSFKNWDSIRKLLSKVKSPLPSTPPLDNIRRTMGDFLKIRGMNLPEEWSNSNLPRGQVTVAPYNPGYPYHNSTAPTQIIGAGQPPNQAPPPTYNVGVNPPRREME